MIQVIYLSLIILVASFVGSLAGFGTSTIMLPILSLFLPLPQVLFFVAIIHFVTNIWKLMLFGRHTRWQLVVYFGLAGIATSYAGARFALRQSPERLLPLLGAFLILYVLFIFVRPTFRLKELKSIALAGGGISGFFAGFFGIRGAIKTAFLSAFDLQKRVHLGTISAIAIMVDTARTIGYWHGGARLTPTLAYGLFIFIPISFVGVRLGYVVLDKVPQRFFRFIVGIFLFIIGIRFLLFS